MPISAPPIQNGTYYLDDLFADETRTGQRSSDTRPASDSRLESAMRAASSLLGSGTAFSYPGQDIEHRLLGVLLDSAQLAYPFDDMFGRPYTADYSQVGAAQPRRNTRYVRAVVRRSERQWRGLALTRADVEGLYVEPG